MSSITDIRTRVLAAMGRSEDSGLLKGLSVRDLVVLALVGRLSSAPMDQIAQEAGMGRWRVRRVLRRLINRGLVGLEMGSGGTSVYVATELGVRLGTATLVARVLDDIQPLAHSWRAFASSRLRIAGPLDRSPLTGPWHPSPGDGPDKLAQMVCDGSSGERSEAVLALGRLRDVAATAKLAQVVLEHPDELTRARAARAMAMSGGPDAAPILRNVAAQGSSVMRAAAAEALGILGDRESRDVLIDLLGFPSSPVREAAAKALGRLGDDGATKPLANALTDQSYLVRRNAREALIALDTSEAIIALRENKRRAPGRRWSDVFQAKAGRRHRERQPLVRIDTRLDRLAFSMYGMSVAWLIATAALLAGAVLLVRASPLLVIPIALVTAVWVTAVVRYGEHARNLFEVPLDIARARAAPLPSARESPALATVIRAASTRPLWTLSIIGLPLCIDALTAGTGIASALVAGLMATWARKTKATGANIARWEKNTNQTILTEPAHNPLPRRQYFVVSRRTVPISQD